jgi:hypothetical protein
VTTYLKSKTLTEEITKWILFGLAGFMLSLFMSPSIQRFQEAPDVQLVGVKSFHIYEDDTDVPVDVTKVTNHRLAVIFKLHSSAPTEAPVHIALIKGCVKFDRPFAYDNLPEEEKPFEAFSYEDYETFKDAVQRITATGVIRDDSVKVPAYGDAYVGALFELVAQGASYGVPGSVSLRGKCSEIPIPQQNPSIAQIFDRGKAEPIGNSLRPEFANGQLAVSLLVGNKELRVSPEQTTQVYPLLATRWDKLDLAAMYNNPDTDFPPVKK